MNVRYSLSILCWYEDETTASSVWSISAAEREEILMQLGRNADVDGVITPEQAEEARRVTDTWLTFENHKPTAR